MLRYVIFDQINIERKKQDMGYSIHEMKFTDDWIWLLRDKLENFNCHENNKEKLREEVLQMATMCIAWLETGNLA